MDEAETKQKDLSKNVIENESRLVTIIIPRCCREHLEDCPHVVRKEPAARVNIAL